MTYAHYCKKALTSSMCLTGFTKSLIFGTFSRALRLPSLLFQGLPPCSYVALWLVVVEVLADKEERKDAVKSFRLARMLRDCWAAVG